MRYRQNKEYEEKIRKAGQYEFDYRGNNPSYYDDVQQAMRGEAIKNANFGSQLIDYDKISARVESDINAEYERLCTIEGEFDQGSVPPIRKSMTIKEAQYTLGVAQDLTYTLLEAQKAINNIPGDSYEGTTEKLGALYAFFDTLLEIPDWFEDQSEAIDYLTFAMAVAPVSLSDFIDVCRKLLLALTADSYNKPINEVEDEIGDAQYDCEKLVKENLEKEKSDQFSR